MTRRRLCVTIKLDSVNKLAYSLFRLFTAKKIEAMKQVACVKNVFFFLNDLSQTFRDFLHVELIYNKLDVLFLFVQNRFFLLKCNLRARTMDLKKNSEKSSNQIN